MFFALLMAFTDLFEFIALLYVIMSFYVVTYSPTYYPIPIPYLSDCPLTPFLLPY